MIFTVKMYSLSLLRTKILIKKNIDYSSFIQLFVQSNAFQNEHRSLITSSIKQQIIDQCIFQLISSTCKKLPVCEDRKRKLHSSELTKYLMVFVFVFVLSESTTLPATSTTPGNKAASDERIIIHLCNFFCLHFFLMVL